jgi:hypothetical protein
MVRICNEATPVGVFPADGAEDVPIDTIPAIWFEEGTCGSASWSATLDTDADPVAMSTYTNGTDDVVLGLDPGRDLDPDTAYTLGTGGSGFGITVNAGFMTGEHAGTPIDAAPSLGDVTAAWEGGDSSRLVVTGRVTPADYDDGLVELVLNGRVVAADLAGEPETLSAEIPMTAPPGEACFTARERDLPGNVTESDETCVAVVDPCGCAAGPGTGSGVVIAGLLVLVLGRRR